MQKPDAEKRVRELREEIELHNYKYYALDNPVISDYEYDKLMAELIELEKEFPELITPDSPTQRVGGAPIKEFAQVRHAFPMLSLKFTYNKDDLAKFDAQVKKELLPGESLEYVVELKIDGVAASLTYKDGMLITAATRGDGAVGDDITHNARTIKSIPLSVRRLPGLLEGKRFFVRGEIYMPLTAFRKMNEDRLNNGEEPFANPRNAAAGSMKQLDPKVVARRGIDMFVYGLVPEGGPTLLGTQYGNLETMKKMGFKVNPKRMLCHNISDVMSQCDLWKDRRHSLDYEIDGIVVKVNSLALWEKLGTTAKEPRYAIVFKFKPPQATTTVDDIIASVGRTGAITPVAVLKPVPLGGVTISSATLHNADELVKLGINRGDTVLIERGGEVIPKVVEVVKKNSEGVFKLPPVCPACGGETVREEGEAATRCINSACPAQLQKNIEHFASRGAMDIDGLGPEVIKLLIKNNLIRDFADLYGIKNVLQLIPLERMGSKSAQNLIDAIKQSKERPLSKLFFALGIRNVGSISAEMLAKQYHSLDDLMKDSAKGSIYVAKQAEIVIVLKQSNNNKRIKIRFCDGTKLDFNPKQFVRVSVHGVEEKINRLLLSTETDDLNTFDINTGGPDSSLYSLNEGDIVGIRGPFGSGFPIGSVMAQSIHDYFKEQRNRLVIDKLEKAGVRTFEERKQPLSIAEKLAGKIFVLTGTLSIPRSEAEAMIKERGGKITSSVSKNTSYVVAGTDPGSKHDKAKELGVEILTENEFRELLNT